MLQLIQQNHYQGIMVLQSPLRAAVDGWKKAGKATVGPFTMEGMSCDFLQLLQGVGFFWEWVVPSASQVSVLWDLSLSGTPHLQCKELDAVSLSTCTPPQTTQPKLRSLSTCSSGFDGILKGIAVMTRKLWMQAKIILHPVNLHPWDLKWRI